MSKAALPGNVFSIPAGCEFLKVLVKAIVDGEMIKGFRPADDPLILSEATIYVPNRRTVRALSTAFLAYFNGAATLLPTIRTLGDADGDEFGISGETSEQLNADVIGALDRQIELASLIQQWKDSIAEETRRLFGDEDIFIPTSASDSIYLAGDLAALLTQISQEEIDWSNIFNVVPEDHAEWWRLTATFLQIIMEHWPAHLAEMGFEDPDEKVVKLLRARAQRMSDQGSSGPVIVAGSTGSVPSTQQLLKVVAGLPNGAVVLPGVDFNMTEPEWQQLQLADPVHDPLVESQPQFGLARTLRMMGVNRENVIQLGRPEPDIEERGRLVSMALSLSEYTADWHESVPNLDQQKLDAAFSDVALIDAGNERQEALAIAIAMRETLSRDGETAALVTPDRNLAGRVSLELERFGIKVDDTAGTPLATTAIAVFVRKLLLLVFGDCRKPLLTSFFKDRLFHARFASNDAWLMASCFEQVALRGIIASPQPGNILGYITHVRSLLDEQEYQSPSAARVDEEDWERLTEWAEKVDGIFEPLLRLQEGKLSLNLKEIAAFARQALLEFTCDEKGNIHAAYEPGSGELESLLDELQSGRAGEFEVEVSEIPTVFDALMSGRVTRANKTTHSRLHIYGPLEARLLHHDRIILAGLNESTWPRNFRSDPFLNRAMRREIGMPSPERRTGLAAHDFQQLIANKEVFLTRSGRVDKAPTVASRWLQRLSAVLGEGLNGSMRERGAKYLYFASMLDSSEGIKKRIQRTIAYPPVDARPENLAVTDIESWIRDPYALYAKKVLGLRPTEPLEREPDALLKGTLYHAVMQRYVEEGIFRQPMSSRVEYLNAQVRELVSVEHLPLEIEKVWLLRFSEISESFVAWEEDQFAKHGDPVILTEISGQIEVGNTGFKLRARADRLERLKDGSIRVMDYKTGNSPTPKQARELSPQLPLEGAIAQAGGFAGLEAGEVADLQFVRLLDGGRFRSESIEVVKGKDQIATAEIMARAMDNLEALIMAYREPGKGYISRFAPFKESEMGMDYDHLARTREWSFGEEEEDGE